MLGSLLFWSSKTHLHPLTVWTVAEEARVRRSRLMTAALAIQNVIYYLQQFEFVAFYAVGTARIIRCHGPTLPRAVYIEVFHLRRLIFFAATRNAHWLADIARTTAAAIVLV